MLFLAVALLVVAALAGASTAAAATPEVTPEEKKRAIDSAEINAAGDLCLDLPWPIPDACIPIPDIPPSVTTPSGISGVARE